MRTKVETAARVNWLPLSLGIALGGGVLLAWNGFKTIRGAGKDSSARSRGMWKLNLGVLIAAISMGAIMVLGK